MSPKLWHWGYFRKRSQWFPNSVVSKDYHGNNQTFENTWCQACVLNLVKSAEDEDARALAQGSISEARLPEDLLEWALKVIQPVSGRREGFEAHIRSCTLISDEVKARLKRESTHNRHISAFDSPSTSPGPNGEESLSSLAASLPLSRMSKAQQAHFESELCKLLVANGIPWHFVNQPQTQIFFQEFVPGAKLPDRNKLSGPVLQAEVRTANDSMRGAVQGRLATGMSDGWKNIKRNSLLASMLSVDYKTYTVKVHDLSAELKTAENHLNLVLKDIDFAEKEHNVRVIAWVSDAGGDSRAMRVRLNRMRPYLLVFDCWAHQINLVVGDILRLNNRLVEAAAGAIEITKWMLHHSHLLGLFRKEQMRNTGKARALTIPAITRWTSHYLSFDSLHSQATTLQSLLLNHPDAFRKSAGRSLEKREQVERIIARIEDRSFWMKLAELKLYLEPLAIAANVSQAPTTRLDHILIELGRLYYTFSRFSFNPAIVECVLQSLERRWAKADQDAFILAVFLNPFIRSRLFSLNNALLNPWGIFSIVKRVFRRVFRRDSGSGLHEAFLDYYNSRNEFHPDRWPYEEYQATSIKNGKPVNMVEIWSGLLPFNAPNSDRHQLAHLAIHILSIVANSAGCERLFSEMGHIHTKRRNRLAYSKVFDTAVVRMDLKRKHGALGLTRSRLKRQFGLVDTVSTLPASDSTVPIDKNDEAAEELGDVDMTEEDSGEDFTALAARLRQDVIEDEDPEDDEDRLDPESATAAPLPKRVRLFFGTQVAIELKDIFNYEHGDGEDGLGLFKRSGMSNLEKELEIHELATREIEEEISEGTIAE